MVSLCRNLLDQVGLLLSQGGDLMSGQDDVSNSGGGAHLFDSLVA